MNDNMVAFAHVGARLDAFFYWTRCVENKYCSTIYHSNLSDQAAREISVRIMVRLIVAEFLAFLRRIRKMSTLSSANVTDVNLVLKERTHMRLCLNMLIFTHNLGNWLMLCISGGSVYQNTELISDILNTDTDVGILNTESTELPTSEYRKFGSVFTSWSCELCYL